MSQLSPTSFQHNTERAGSTTPDVAFCTTSDPHTLAIYVGPRLIGYVRAAPGAKFWAVNRDRLLVGTFDDIHSAMCACASAP